jgi:hypothetical protein
MGLRASKWRTSPWEIDGLEVPVCVLNFLQMCLIFFLGLLFYIEDGCSTFNLNAGNTYLPKRTASLSDALQNLRDQFSLSVRNVDWIHLDHDKGQWWAFGNKVMYFWVPQVGKGRIVWIDILTKFSNKYSCSIERRIIFRISLRYYQILKKFSNKYSRSIERRIISWISLRYYQLLKKLPTHIHNPPKGK